MMERSSAAKYDLDGRPPLKESIPLGLQHVLAMFVGNIVPMIMVAQAQGLDAAMSTLLLQSAMLGAAIATLLQLFPIKFGQNYQLGAGLPVFMGLTYIFLPTLMSIATNSSLSVIFGAQIVGSFASIFFGLALRRIRKYFPPVVTGSIIVVIGFSLFPMAITNIAGGSGAANFGSYLNWAIGTVVIVVILLITSFGKGLLKDASILVGILSGYAVAVVFGLVDFSSVAPAAWFAIPRPLAFGLKFEFDMIGLFSIMFVIAAVQMMGDFTTSSVGGLGREPTDKELQGGIIANGVTGIIGAIFNSFPTATYSQNSGIVAFNKVASRFVIGTGAVVLLVASFMPKLGALISTIPFPVIGGATIVVFGMIAVSGINLIASEPIDQRAMLIVGLSVGIGLSLINVSETLNQFPPLFQTFFGNSSIVVTSVLAFILNLALPKPKEKQEVNVEKTAEVEV